MHRPRHSAWIPLYWVIGLASLCLMLSPECSFAADNPTIQSRESRAEPGLQGEGDLKPLPPRKQKKRRHYLVKSLGFGFNYFRQGLTAKGSDGNDYLLTNQFTGLHFGWYQILNWKLRKKLAIGVSSEGYFGFSNVNLNETGNPPAIFTYSAKNYPAFGVRSFAELNYSHKRWVYSLALGAGIGFLSLPAPNANIAVSAPSSAQLFLIERLVVHYLLNPLASLYLGVGALGSPSNTEIMLGVKLPR